MRSSRWWFVLALACGAPLACGDVEAPADGTGSSGTASGSSSGETSASSSGAPAASSSGGAGPGDTDGGGVDAETGSSSGASPPPVDAGEVLAPGPYEIGPSARPATLRIPTGYAGTPMPLLLMLHGTGESAASFESYVKMAQVADARGFFLLHADGTNNLFGLRSWNASSTCCSYVASPPDDSSYLLGLIDEASNLVAVDARRTYAFGHSAGAFMSYRLACDHADRIAAIASLAGATLTNASACAPSEPVHVLQLHGEGDGTVSYTGGSFGIYGGSYPGAVTSVSRWAGYNGCAASAAAGPARDLLTTAGAETSTRVHPQCPAGGSAELWTLGSAGHFPSFGPTFGEQLAEWLLARAKP